MHRCQGQAAEAITNDKETVGLDKKTTEAETGLPKKTTSRTVETKTKTESREVQSIIDSRLHLLTKMYTAHSEGETDEEEDRAKDENK